jgi:hypothetical protein
MGRRNFAAISVNQNTGVSLTVNGDVDLDLDVFLEWLDVTLGASVARTDANTLSVLSGDFRADFYDGRRVQIIEDTGGPTYGTCDGTPTFGGGNTSVDLKDFTGGVGIPSDLNAVFLHGSGRKPKFVMIKPAAGDTPGNAIYVTPTGANGDLSQAFRGLAIDANNGHSIILNVLGVIRLSFNETGDGTSLVYVIPLEDF